ncbi:MAG: hypothetical protein JWS10_2052 [Cypionkella sp.]|nr:hypothetical protein [Cypionkella sp.]
MARIPNIVRKHRRHRMKRQRGLANENPGKDRHTQHRKPEYPCPNVGMQPDGQACHLGNFRLNAGKASASVSNAETLRIDGSIA